MNQALMQCLLGQLHIIANKEYFRVVSQTCHEKLLGSCLYNPFQRFLFKIIFNNGLQP